MKLKNLRGRRIIRTLVLLSGLVLCFSCDKLLHPASSEDGFVTYLIKAGNHEVNLNTWDLFNARVMVFQAIFDSSCVYQTRLPGNQHDINKLMGFSDCGSHHQENSARFGWNWRDNALRVYVYCYVNGVEQKRELGAVELNKTHDFSLSASDRYYHFNLNGTKDSVARHCTGGLGVAYRLLPYFGGNEPAPHDIRIKIKRL